jgi:cytochrome c oxidase assembly factor CtaG
VRSRPRLPWWRAVSFYAGLITLFVALVSPIASLAHELFLVHMVQHLLMIMVGIPLVLLGAPGLPLLQGMPRPVRGEIVRPLARQRWLRGVMRLLTNPLVALAAYVALLTLWHLPPLYDYALVHRWAHELEHVTFLAIGALFWGQVIDPVPWRAPLAHPLRIVYLFVATAHNTILGGILSFAEGPLYTYYVQRADRLFGVSAAADQQWGGIIMWVPGGMVHLLAISVVFALWLASEDRPVESRPSPITPR